MPISWGNETPTNLRTLKKDIKTMYIINYVLAL